MNASFEPPDRSIQMDSITDKVNLLSLSEESVQIKKKAVSKPTRTMHGMDNVLNTLREVCTASYLKLNILFVLFVCNKEYVS